MGTGESREEDGLAVNIHRARLGWKRPIDRSAIVTVLAEGLFCLREEPMNMLTLHKRTAVANAAASILAVTCLFIFATPLTAGQSESVLHSFTGALDGSSPYAGLFLDHDGNLYGTTLYGGGSSLCTNGCGMVFRLSISGGETVLYSFGGGTDGANPYGGLVLDAKGNLYGTTTSGGFFVGTVFQLNPAGMETLLHTFNGSNGGDGSSPFEGLIQDAQGNLYGTTFSGGSQCSSIGGCGTVFEVSPSGVETVLYSFSGGNDGGYPFSSLLLAPNGDLYGTTVFGGTYNQGTVFRLTSAGAETVLYSFTGGVDGAQPLGGLVFDGKRSILGTTSKGGASGNGTVFKITPTGKQAVIYSFHGGTDGSVPDAGVIVDKKGRIFGTTNQGGASGLGTVFGLTPSGQERVLYSFKGGSDGAFPTAGLVQDGNGNFFGTTSSGGAAGLGTVYEVIQ